MNDFKSQLCPKCMYDPDVQGDDEKMKKVLKLILSQVQKMVRGDLVNDNIRLDKSNTCKENSLE